MPSSALIIMAKPISSLSMGHRTHGVELQEAATWGSSFRQRERPAKTKTASGCSSACTVSAQRPRWTSRCLAYTALSPLLLLSLLVLLRVAPVNASPPRETTSNASVVNSTEMPAVYVIPPLVPSTASVVVFPASNESCDLSAVDGRTGAVCFSSCDATEVINTALGPCLAGSSATASGGVVVLRRGVYNLTSPINISSSGVTLQGEGGGDLYFTADGTFHGVTNKAATILVASGSFDAVQVGGGYRARRSVCW